MFKKLIITLLILTAVCPPAAFAQAKRRVALLLVNGKVFTADEKHTLAEAVAIDGERIVAVGATADLRARFQAAREIDLAGRLVTPGFNDAHVHFFNGALSLLSVNLFGAKSAAEAAARVAEKAKTTPKGEWIVGRGWDHTLWGGKFPTRADLDRVAPDNPVYLTRVDGHVAWVNTAALRLAGVTRATANPEGGEIERDAAGEATGIMKETSSELVAAKIPAPTDAQKTKAMELAVELARKYGITSVQDNSGYETTKLYRALLKADKLTVRVSEWLDFEDSVDELKRQRDEFKAFGDDPNRLHLGAVKGYVDGTLGSKTAAMLAPFDDDDKNSGIPRRSQEDLTAKVVALDAAGFQVTVHAIGDKANRMALNAFEAAAKSRRAGGAPDARLANPRRHRVEHAQVVNPLDFKRYAELDIIASMQPTHATSDMRWAESRLGEYRVLGAYAWHFMRSYGVHVPFGTDFPVEWINPYETLYAAVARQDKDGMPAGGWQPQEKLSMAEAIRCHTYESAYAEFAENEKGVIREGMLADLVVHSKDLLTIAPQEILATEPVYTIFNGRVIYEK